MTVKRTVLIENDVVNDGRVLTYSVNLTAHARTLCHGASSAGFEAILWPPDIFRTGFLIGASAACLPARRLSGGGDSQQLNLFRN
jgi:hypothetical protein